MRGRITIPRVGAWVADLATDDDAALGASCRVVVGDLELVGWIYRAEPWQGSTRVRCVGGMGGWARILPARWYASQGGVRRTVLVRDLASEAGERMADAPVERFEGVNYCRPEQAAASTLFRLGVSWRVRPDGATSCAAWPSTALGDVGQIMGYQAERNVVTVALEEVTNVLPGATFNSPRLPPRSFTIADVVHAIEPERIRSELWCLP